MSKLRWADFEALDTFRARHGLPMDFGIVSLFPKDFSGMGRLHPHHPYILGNAMRSAVLTAPDRSSAAYVDHCTHVFRDALDSINSQIGLSPEQADFAVNGFSDMLWHVHYGRMGQDGMSTESLLAAFIEDSLHLSSAAQSYEHQGDCWQVWSVSSLFGRVGLRVTSDMAQWHVRDERYACPMQTFMLDLVQAVG